jgi:hypothetical protein
MICSMARDISKRSASSDAFVPGVGMKAGLEKITQQIIHLIHLIH